MKEQVEKRKEKQLEAAREAYIRAHPHVYFINLPEHLRVTSRRTGREGEPMKVVNFEDDSSMRKDIEARLENFKPEKNFMELNKHRVGLISAGAKAYQQLQAAAASDLPLKTTLTHMVFDSRETKGKERLVEKLEELKEIVDKKDEDV